MKLRAVKIEKKLFPEWNDNKKQTVDEQLSIEFSRIPATSEMGNYKTYKFDSGGNIQIVYNDNLMISTFVSKVNNLEIVSDSGDVAKIKTGVELATASHPKLQGLFTEIRSYLFPDDEDFTAGE